MLRVRGEIENKVLHSYNVLGDRVGGSGPSTGPHIQPGRSKF